jgi:hypothetical protein
MTALEDASVVAYTDVHEHRCLLEGDLVRISEILDDAVDGLDRGRNARHQVQFLLPNERVSFFLRASFPALEVHIVVLVLRLRGGYRGDSTGGEVMGGRGSKGQMMTRRRPEPI